MLLVGMLARAARYGLFALGAQAGTRWMVLAGIVLHGICYDFFFVTGQIYVDKVAPVAARGLAQGLLILVTQGLGMLIGAQVSAKLFSLLVQHRETEVLLGWRHYWLISCAAAAVIMLLFALLFKSGAQEEAR